MNYRKSYTLFWGGIWLAVLLALLYFCVRWAWVVAIAVIVSLGASLQAAIFYRCPNCGESLDPRTKRPEYCPHCGDRLDD